MVCFQKFTRRYFFSDFLVNFDGGGFCSFTFCVLKTIYTNSAKRKQHSSSAAFISHNFLEAFKKIGCFSSFFVIDLVDIHIMISRSY